MRINVDFVEVPSSISKSLPSLLGIYLFLANQEKEASNSLASTLANLGTWQISPPPCANIRAREGLGIAVSRRLRDSRRAKPVSLLLLRAGRNFIWSPHAR